MGLEESREAEDSVLVPGTELTRTETLGGVQSCYRHRGYLF